MIAASALMLAVAAWILVLPPADPRLEALLPRAAPTPRPAMSRDAFAWIAAATAAVGALALLPLPVNALAGVACLLVLPRVIGRLESRADRRRADDLARQAPVAADLLAATLVSGAPMRSALAAVMTAVAEPTSGRLGSVVAALDLGADPEEAWSTLVAEPALGSIAAAVVRSSRTGAPLSAVLARLADDLRRERRAVVEVAARTAGVRAVVPLAACFLPAFILLGVVPVVAALASQLIGP